MKSAMLTYGATDNIHWIPCASHRIQLCINKGVERTPAAKAIVEKCRSTSTLFRNSSVAMDINNRLQDRMLGKRCKFLTTNVTRWNSEYDMASRVLLLKDTIRESHNSLVSGSREAKAKGAELGRYLLDEEEGLALKEIIDLLKPIAAFTHWAGSLDRSTTSQMYHRVFSLFSELEPPDSAAAHDLRVQLDNLIQEYFPIKDIPDVVLIAIYLNPACVALKMLDSLRTADGTPLRAKALNLTLAALEKFKEEKARQNAPPPQPQNTQEASFTIVRGMNSFQLEALGTLSNYASTIANDPDNFLKYKDSPQAFWIKMQQERGFQDLADLARSYLCIQATSAESERLFSKAGLILSPLRTRLSDTNFSNLLFARSFYKLKKLDII